MKPTPVLSDGKLLFRRECPTCGCVSDDPDPNATCPGCSPTRSILETAARVVDGPRRESYGTPKENHERTAALWSAFLGVPITAAQVCMLNILQKVSRERHAHNLDNLVDIAGYARNAQLVAE